MLLESRLCEVRAEVFCKFCLFARTCSMEPPPEVVVLTYRLCAAPRVGGPTGPRGLRNVVVQALKGKEFSFLGI